MTNLETKDRVCQEMNKAKSILNVMANCHPDWLNKETVPYLAIILQRIIENLEDLFKGGSYGSNP